jgi:hypothetical protein
MRCAATPKRFRLSALLQIVPRSPGAVDGVGDYALTIAKKLRQNFGCDSVFATFEAETKNERMEFQCLPLDDLPQSNNAFSRILLHYVNYGFQKRGVPFHLVSLLRKLQAQAGGKVVTVFHELYASGPPWRSAFWLRPLQKRLAKAIARLSDVCIVSNQNFQRELKQMVPGVCMAVHPIPSALGEPVLSDAQIADRDAHDWVIVGGTALVQRSLESFARFLKVIPESISPKRLFVLGGNDNPAVPSVLAGLSIKASYRPLIQASDASHILATCSFAWFDYFRQPHVQTSVVLKSSAFAAACAHAVIPLFPHSGSQISINNDALPGPFFVTEEGFDVPTEANRAKTASEIYCWYRRNASSDLVVSSIASAFAFKT